MGRGEYRTNDMLSSKWRDMNLKVRKFNGIYSQKWQTRRSGQSDAMIEREAEEQYREEFNAHFSLQRTDKTAMLFLYLSSNLKNIHRVTTFLTPRFPFQWPPSNSSSSSTASKSSISSQTRTLSFQQMFDQFNLIMKLYVYVLEGRNLAVEESFVKLKVGTFKSRTRALNNTDNPIWNEEFAFRVRSLEEDELTVSVYHVDGDDEDGLFKHSSGDLVGRVRIPLLSVAAEEDHHSQPTWYSLRNHKSNKSFKKECG
ncbi:hypothetical protein E3N88_25844 [Mikania micrantha]|uniref:C2 domain-containing protein n=1 Tax=Mikania micrantha TaxID=192012 RepID=A0A5N6N5V7_9ASTR|nr:hypothetical protein E3N88_25844 [Mikania micrantha]